MDPVANFRFNILVGLEKIADSLEDDTQKKRSTSGVAKKSVLLDYHNTIICIRRTKPNDIRV